MKLSVSRTSKSLRYYYSNSSNRLRLASTIAMARGLLTDGRAMDVAHMLEPLLEPLPTPFAWDDEDDASQLVLRSILARIRLLHHGDALEAAHLLTPFEHPVVRDRLPDAVRAEITCWLGWLHAWQDPKTYDEGRAIGYFTEAQAQYKAQFNANGLCWTLLGLALTYLSIDEYPLMAQALREAQALNETRTDTEADLWIHDLQAAKTLYRGRFAAADSHIQALLSLSQQHQNPIVQGRSHIYRALLFYDLGRPSEQIIAEAQEARARLTSATPRPLTMHLAAYRVEIRTLVRSGQKEAAQALIERARRTFADHPSMPAYILLQDVRLHLIGGAYEKAQACMQAIFAHMPHYRHPLLASKAALMQGELFEHQGAYTRSQQWIERAYQAARETGHHGQELIALLCLAKNAIHLNQFEQAHHYLRQASQFDAYLSVLSFAALRFRIEGQLAAAENRPDDAQASLTQALAAYSMLGNTFRTAQMQLAVAKLGHVPFSQAYLLLEQAKTAFQKLHAHEFAEAVQRLQEHYPPASTSDQGRFENHLATALKRASVSVELVAETWLQTLGTLLPNRWIGVYACSENQAWTCIQEHGTVPSSLTFPTTSAREAIEADTYWIRLRAHPDRAFFLGIYVDSADDAIWQYALQRLRPWLPVLQLALAHALLRANRLESAPAPLIDRDEVARALPYFIYTSSASRDLAEQIVRIRASHSPVLITGESGTGKELVAQAVHALSERKDAAFIAFNCSTVPPELFDSHLFGHEKGAFTGAHRAQPGVIRAAEGGTLFLDEIGDLPLNMQPKLLRFLQEGEVFPLGARQPITVNVRIIAATNQNLEARMRAGQFREDLYYRLNVIPLEVLPLRERRADIPVLVRHFLNTLRATGAPVASITRQAMEALIQYDWPGNVRQLRNEIERALVFVGSEPAPMIDDKDLAPRIRQTASGASPLSTILNAETFIQPGHDLEEILTGTERVLIERVLSQQEGHVTSAANVLGLTRQGLYKKIKRLGIDTAQFQRTPPRRPTALHLN